MIHLDDWLSAPSFQYDREAYAKFVLNYFRYPAWMQIAFKPYMEEFKLFCTYENKRYRVIGASRFGDIWLTKDFEQETGYQKRAVITECSNWSDNPLTLDIRFHGEEE